MEYQKICNNSLLTENLDLCVFISSKNRYNRFNDYKVTITHLLNMGGNKVFRHKFLNLKIFKNDIENAQNIINFFKNLGFEISIIEDNNDINDNDRYFNRQKFISGIAKDIANFFTKYEKKLAEYVFILEDDSPIIIKQYSLEYYLNKSIINLQTDKNLEGIHFLRLSHGEIPVSSEDWFIRHEIKIPDLSNEVYTEKYWYNFQPRVNRTLDIVNVSKIINMGWQNYFQFLHPEDAFDKAFKSYNPNIKYHAFSPDYAYSIHLGAEPNFHNLVVNSESEINELYKNLNI